ELVAMGFPAALAKQALLLCQNSVEAAADMLLSNPPPLPAESVEAEGATSALAEPLAELLAMGFDEMRARGALSIHGSLEAAAEALLLEQDGAVAADASSSQRNQSSATPPVAVESVEDPPPLAADTTDHEPPRKRARRSRHSEIQGSEGRNEHGVSVNVEHPDGGLSVASLAEKFAFGPAAFGPIASRSPAEASDRTTLLSANDVVRMVVASHPQAAKMRGERGQQKVTRMLSNCFAQGLWTFGPPCSPVNTEVRPAFRYIMSEMHKLEPKNPKRVSIITTLVHACEDCQQVQAREILRIYGDLTSQNQTFEQQLKYSLLRQKEVALNRFITDKHKGCDLDHTQVQPQQQRPHLFSGYVAYIGEDFGLDGLDAAKNDRYLSQVWEELERKKALKKPRLLQALQREMSVTEWLQTLLADINNQSAEANRLINRGCIFNWVQANLSNEAAYLVFCDEERADEFKGQDPEKPTAENQYQPFLSTKVLVEMLVQANFLIAKDASS
ncbi:unnamed protein product, partial [Symbiodinium natans]